MYQLAGSLNSSTPPLDLDILTIREESRRSELAYQIESVIPEESAMKLRMVLATLTFAFHFPLWAETTAKPASPVQPPKKMSIFIMMGQSNMSGAGPLADIPAGYPVNPAKIWIFTNAWTWRTAFEPVDSAEGQVDKVSEDIAAGVGPGLSFADTLIDKKPSEVVALVPCAKGGKSITEWGWSTERSTLYGSCLARIKAAKEFGTIKAILWHQGESDTDSIDQVNRWPDRFKALVKSIRKDLGNERLPVIYGQIGQLSQSQRTRPDKHFFYWDSLKIKQAEIRIPYSAMVRTDHLAIRQDDGLHLTTASQIAMGKLFAKAYLGLGN
jgi:hypothetical protein